MKASEVRELIAKRKKVLAGCDKILYDKIIEDIVLKVTTAKDEVRELYWTGEMTKYVSSQLERDGFTVKYESSPRGDESHHVISWEQTYPDNGGIYDR